MNWRLASLYKAQPRGPTSMRRGLASLVLVSAFPFVVFAAFLLVRAADAQRETLMARGEQSLRGIVNSLDQDFARASSLLRGLSVSRMLRDGEFEGFFDQIGVKLPQDGGVIIFDVKAGRTVTRGGSGLASAQAEAALRETARTGQERLSDIFPTEGEQRYVSIFTEPVALNGETRFVLGLVVPTESINTLLAAQSLPASWIVGIFDGAGLTVARTQRPEFVGRLVRPDLLEAMRKANQGWIENVTREGVRVENTFARTSLGWSVAIGIPTAEFNAPVFQSLLLTSAIGILLATLALLLAFMISNHLAEPIAALVGAARDLGRGLKPRPIPSAIREVEVIQSALYEAHTDLSRKEAERRRAEEGVRESEERLRLALESGGLGTWEFDPQAQTFLTSDRCRAIFGFSADEAFTYADLMETIHPDDRPRQQAVVQAAIEGRTNFSIEYRIMPKDGALRWVRIDGKALGGGNGAVKLVGVSQDITPRKTAEQLRTLLMNELNHRVKNSLAQIVAITHFTRRSQGNSPAAWDALESRIHAMAKTHDLLTASDWRGGSLQDVLWNELGHYQDEAGSRITLEGEAVALSPKATLALGLAAHELTTNAAKYGALSVPAGRVTVRWSVEPKSGARQLDLTWTEMGGPTVNGQGAKGFGSRLIEQVFTRELGGTVHMTYSAEGLSCRAVFPLIPADPAQNLGYAARISSPPLA